MSQSGFASLALRFVERDWNATQCGTVRIDPSSEGSIEAPFPWRCSLLMLMRLSEPVRCLRLSPAGPRGRCQMKTSVLPLVSPRIRSDADEWKATRRILRLSPETVAPPEGPFAASCDAPTEIGSGSVPNRFGWANVP